MVSLGKLSLLAFMTGVLLRCSSTGVTGADGGVIDTHYTLKLGKQTLHAAPLPTEQSILVERHDSEGGMRTKEGFRGWDFDGDGRYEMVEVLSETGAVQALVFDFDGDGTIDLKKEDLK